MGLFFTTPEQIAIEKGCSERQRKKHKFLWFVWETSRPHFWELHDIDRWGALSWRNYEITLKCRDCGLSYNRFGVSEAELVSNGQRQLLIDKGFLRAVSEDEASCKV